MMPANANLQNITGIDINALFQQLEKDLLTPRVINQQVLNYIADHYGFHAERLGVFFAEKISELEDYELDLTFSPLFTPTVHDRKAYGTILGAQALTSEQIAELERVLEDKRLSTTFVTYDGTEYPLLLKDVTIHRYVGRLFLDKPLASELYKAIERLVPQEQKGLVLMLSREDLWHEPGRRALLEGFLSLYHNQDCYPVDKLLYLTDFIRTYRPHSLPDLQRQLDSLIQSCEADLEKVRNRRYHDHELAERYSHSDVARAKDEEVRVIESYTYMMAMASQLKLDCQQLQ
jgi:hypothetical protein